MGRWSLEQPQDTSFPSSLGLLVLRLVAGGQLLWLHGVQWWRGLEGRTEAFADPLQLGSTTSAWISIAVALIGGGLVAAGLFTRVVSAVLASGLIWQWLQNASFETLDRESVGLYAAALLALVTGGGGCWSLDAVVFRRG